MRSAVFPVLERHYPSIRKTLAGYAHHRFESDQGLAGDSGAGLLNILQAVMDGPLNRAQRSALSTMLKDVSPGKTLSLPGGGQLKRLKTGWLIEDSGSDNQV